MQRSDAARRRAASLPYELRDARDPPYITELVRLIGSEHRRRPLAAGDVRALDVPSGIRDVLLRRAGRLPDDTQSLLMVAAVAGSELQPDLLEHVTGADAEHLLLGLEPAIAAGLITTAGSGWGFRFRHPLIHESLYASAGQVERARRTRPTRCSVVPDERKPRFGGSGISRSVRA